MKKPTEDIFFINTKQFFLDMKDANIPVWDFSKVLNLLIELPFFVPIPDGLYTTINKEDCIISICFFTTIKEIDNQKSSFVPFNISQKEVSRVELFYAGNFNVIDQEIISKIFNELLEIINTILLAYIQTTNDYNVYELTRCNIEPISIFRILSPKNNECLKTGIFWLNSNKINYQKELLSPKEMQKLSNFFYIYTFKQNPLALLVKNYYLGIKDFYNNNFRHSILFLQTYIESFLKMIYFECYKEKGMSEKDINTNLENISFMNIVKKEMPKLLGGCWDINKSDKEIYSWYNDVYLLRNNIIHSGYLPNFEEAQNAVNSVENFLLFIRNRIKKNKKKYPTLSQYIQ